MVLSGVTHAPAQGQQSVTFSTSSDTQPVTVAYTLTPGNQPVASFTGISLTTTAAGASGANLSFDMTLSKTGALVPFAGNFTITGPAGSLFSGVTTFTDQTAGTSGTVFSGNYTVGNGGATVSIPPPIVLNGGDHVQVTIQQVTNAGTAGLHTFTLNTSSDTQPVTATYTLTPANAVSAPGVTLSTQQPGGDATYTAAFTASRTGGLIPDQGLITVTGAPGTVFSPGAACRFDDVTTS